MTENLFIKKQRNLNRWELTFRNKNIGTVCSPDGKTDWTIPLGKGKPDLMDKRFDFVCLRYLNHWLDEEKLENDSRPTNIWIKNSHYILADFADKVLFEEEEFDTKFKISLSSAKEMFALMMKISSGSSEYSEEALDLVLKCEVN